MIQFQQQEFEVKMKKKILIALIILIAIFSVIFCFFNANSFMESHMREIIQINTRTQPDVADSHLGSFKEFILKNDTKELLEKLYKNLDKESVQNLDLALLTIMNVPDFKYKKYFYFDYKRFDDDFMPFEEKVAQRNYEKELPTYKKKYKLSRMNKVLWMHGVFYDKHNLRFANDKIKNYIKDKIFIDGGAYIGDSVIVMYEFNPKVIYSFDLSDRHEKHYLETLKMNNIPSDKYKFYKYALSDSKATYKITGKWDSEGIYTTDELPEDAIDVQSTDLDSFLKENKLNNEKIGFIKCDVQGAMHKAILGMKETIRKDRPVLLLDISDSPQDFFYTKPLLDDITKDLNYTIKITKFPGVSALTGLSIWAYPKELDE